MLELILEGLFILLPRAGNLHKKKSVFRSSIMGDALTNLMKLANIKFFKVYLTGFHNLIRQLIKKARFEKFDVPSTICNRGY